MFPGDQNPPPQLGTTVLEHTLSTHNAGISCPSNPEPVLGPGQANVGTHLSLTICPSSATRGQQYGKEERPGTGHPLSFYCQLPTKNPEKSKNCKSERAFRAFVKQCVC